MTSFAQNLAPLVVGRDLAALAEETDIDLSRLQALVRGEATPYVSDLWSLADALGVVTSRMLDGVTEYPETGESVVREWPSAYA